MRIDPLTRYLQLQEVLKKQKETLEARLAQIKKALAGLNAAPPAAMASRPGRRGGRRLPNKMSLREAIVRATSARPLTKEEILSAVQRLGYRFSTDKPLASVCTILYSNRQFKNVNGRFSPARAAAK
jgi:hypothetical protein